MGNNCLALSIACNFSMGAPNASHAAQILATQAKQNLPQLQAMKASLSDGVANNGPSFGKAIAGMVGGAVLTAINPIAGAVVGAASAMSGALSYATNPNQPSSFTSHSDHNGDEGSDPILASYDCAADGATHIGGIVNHGMNASNMAAIQTAQLNDKTGNLRNLVEQNIETYRKAIEGAESAGLWNTSQNPLSKQEIKPPEAGYNVASMRGPSPMMA